VRSVPRREREMRGVWLRSKTESPTGIRNGAMPHGEMVNYENLARSTPRIGCGGWRFVAHAAGDRRHARRMKHHSRTGRSALLKLWKERFWVMRLGTANCKLTKCQSDLRLRACHPICTQTERHRRLFLLKRCAIKNRYRHKKQMLIPRKADKMTLKQAVAILNAQRHHAHSDWYISEDDTENCIVFGKDQYDFFEPFEAIAIAEKYQSEIKKLSIQSPRACQ
jgi:hypothetical protein